MPYCMSWIRKPNPQVFSGPILGRVMEDVFIPFTAKEAMEKVNKYNAEESTQVMRFITKVEMTLEEIWKVQSVYPAFFSVFMNYDVYRVSDISSDAELSEEEAQKTPILDGYLRR